MAGGGSGNIEHRTLNVEILEHCRKEAPVLRSVLWNYGRRAKGTGKKPGRFDANYTNGRELLKPLPTAKAVSPLRISAFLRASALNHSDWHGCPHHRVIEIPLVPKASTKWCLSTRIIFRVVLPAKGTELLFTSVTTRNPRSICHLAS